MRVHWQGLVLGSVAQLVAQHGRDMCVCRCLGVPAGVAHVRPPLDKLNFVQCSAAWWHEQQQYKRAASEAHQVQLNAKWACLLAAQARAHTEPFTNTPAHTMGEPSHDARCIVCVPVDSCVAATCDLKR